MKDALPAKRSDGMIETLLAPGLTADSGTPLNEQLMTLLQEAILAGTLAPGDRLPASRAMAARLAISRNTVLAAYDQLTAEGYLESRTGAGTYVSTDLPEGYMDLGRNAHRNIAPQNPAPNRPLAGMPALDEFPFALWGRLAGRVWRHADAGALQHNDPAGYKPLRQAIATYLQASRGVTAHADQIMITSGLQQGLRFVAEAIVPPEKTIILEDPGFPGLLKTARHLPHPLAFTGVDRHGATVPSPTTTSPGLLLITPSRQYPLGMTMPISRRLELLDWAQDNGALILEDDYDSEFRYGGRPVQSLQGLDGGQHVIYGGSFSKSLFLSLRLGYLVLPPALAEQVILHRDRTASFPAIGDQLVLTRFIEDGHFARHLRRLRAIHKERLTAFLDAAKAHLGQFLDIQETDAGLHVAVFYRKDSTLPPDTDLAPIAHTAGLGAVPLSRCFTRSDPRPGLLFGFANMACGEIDSRLKRLGDTLAARSGF